MTNNVRILAVAATLALGGLSAAHADSPAVTANPYGESYPMEQAAPSTLTREAVVADLVAARANGTLPRDGEWYNVPAPVGQSDATTLTREQVRNEAIAATRNRFAPNQIHGDY